MLNLCVCVCVCVCVCRPPLNKQYCLNFEANKVSRPTAVSVHACVYMACGWRVRVHVHARADARELTGEACLLELIKLH